MIFLLAALVCQSPQHRALDFWVGDWDVFDVGSEKPSAHVKVEKILGDCVLHELYEDPAHKGESFSLYDASRGVWHQTWVTDRGQLLVIEGKFDNDSLTLTGEDRDDNGRPRITRGVWKRDKDGVRETAWRSIDGGKTWQPWFDLLFKPRGH